MGNDETRQYTEHEGTIKISGKTIPKDAGFCALSYLRRGIEVIDFFYIGGNAGHQAMKAMSVFAYLVDRDSSGKMSVSFKPIRHTTMTVDAVTHEQKLKDAAVWRTVLLGQQL